VVVISVNCKDRGGGLGWGVGTQAVASRRSHPHPPPGSAAPPSTLATPAHLLLCVLVLPDDIWDGHVRDVTQPHPRPQELTARE
jgi:hypothetical protein